MKWYAVENEGLVDFAPSTDVELTLVIIFASY